MGYRLDAQSGPHDRRIVPDQGPTDRLAHRRKWFWDTLVDADLTSNSANWQWVAGCGADAAPYFRIFNPSLQETKFNPEGAYVRRWVPKLSNLPNNLIHVPWIAKPIELSDAGIDLGCNYPTPIIDHAIARNRALEKYKNLKTNLNVA